MKTSISALATIVALGAAPAMAAHLDYYTADLAALNGSGVSGTVFLTYDGPEDDGLRKLTVQVAARGLEPGAHAAHIHGFPIADREASVAPTDDVFMPNVAGPGNDGDGFTELLEGADFYGGILETLTGLTADGAGRVFYSTIFDVTAGGELDDDVFSLDNREIVLHGMTVDVAPDGPGGVDGFTPAPANFNAFLPIATAKFERATLDDRPDMTPVPLPAAGWFLIMGMGGLGAMRRFGRKTA
ncbi:VPLPA-CTERM sorting domain-containing protein [Sulfitobacter sp. D35]|uniref:VPLPA-CTERM sorting domain-containing protein n=1 Tax=Sulfitobacter sp. D35 TaxID=3083252 RepID=UPI00296E7A9B|nr:VPLPA-CTERM sorting domain-containing protein [Sulfitobacter sp. D35]MDW4500071.1 VPLPA-CTERM sorting domain-containing protein [Sulfitobacter sp. D35]